MKNNYALIVILFFTPLPALVAEFLLDEKFLDGDWKVQSPPESLEYFFSSEDEFLVEANGSLTMTDMRSYFWGYLTEPDEYISLEVGETLALQVTFKAAINQRAIDFTSRPFRIGLFDSSGGIASGRRLVTGDRVGFKNEIFTNVTGYMGRFQFFEPDEFGGVTKIAKRSFPHDSLMLATRMGDSAFKTIETLKIDSVSDPGVVNTAQIYVKRVASESVEVVAIIVVGGSDSEAESEIFIRVTDSDDPATRFDMIGVAMSDVSNSFTQLEIQSIQVFKLSN